ncbi:hypothetical protein [Shewanella phage FishSpeaker]|nr:hypothetical protein [Shewanella phage FishSpeaker]
MDKHLHQLLDAKTLLVGHLDPLALFTHFWNKVDCDSDNEYSVEQLYKAIAQEITYFENADSEIDETFFNLLTIDGMYEVVQIKLLDVCIMAYCHDGEYREMPAIILTVRKNYDRT